MSKRYPLPISKQNIMTTVRKRGDFIKRTLSLVTLFQAILKNTLTPLIGALTSFARVATQPVDDFEGATHTALSGEAPFDSARRLESILVTQAGLDPNDISVGYVAGGGLVIVNATTVRVNSGNETLTNSGTGPYTALLVTDTILMRLRLKKTVGSGTQDVRLGMNDVGGAALVYTGVVFKVNADDYDTFYGLITGFSGAGTSAKAIIDFRNVTLNDEIEIHDWCVYNLNPSTTLQYPGELLLDQDYGANVNAVQYYSETNPNNISPIVSRASLNCIETPVHQHSFVGDSLTNSGYGDDLNLLLSRGFKRTEIGASDESLGGRFVSKYTAPGTSTQDWLEANIAQLVTNGITHIAIQGAMYNDFAAVLSDAVVVARTGLVNTSYSEMTALCLLNNIRVTLVGDMEQSTVVNWTTAKSTARAALTTHKNQIAATAAGISLSSWLALTDGQRDTLSDASGVFVCDWFLAVDGATPLQDTSDPDNIFIDIIYAPAGDPHINATGRAAVAVYQYATNALAYTSRPAFRSASTAITGVRGLLTVGNIDARYTPADSATLFKADLNDITITGTYEPKGTPTFGATDTLFNITSGTSELWLFYNTTGNLFTFRKLVAGVPYDATANLLPAEGTEYNFTANIDSVTGVHLTVNAVTDTSSDANTTDIDLSSATYISVGSDAGANNCQGTIKDINVY